MAIRSQTDRILTSEPFLNSERLKRFLVFVVDRAIQGRADQLKEYVIATEVFDRKDTFDPRLHSVVRVEAGKLRSKLKDYYDNQGAGDPIVIELPKGSYSPVFRVRESRPPMDSPGELAAQAEKTRADAKRLIGPQILLAAAIALLSIGGAALWILSPREGTPRPITRLAVAPPAGATMAVEFQSSVAFSPDGTRILYAAKRDGHAQLFLRLMDRFDATPIAGTEETAGPFFSPDGLWAGFFADNRLKKVSLTGGVPQVLCEAPSGRGASWGRDGTIIFTPASAPGTGLSRISAAGGPPKVLTKPESSKGEVGHRWPEVLPGGEAVLFTVWTGGGFDTARIAILSLKTLRHRILIEGGSNAH